MFRHLVSVGHQRTTGQAIGFYLFYLVAGIVMIWSVDRVSSIVAPAQEPASTRPTRGSTAVNIGRNVNIAVTPDGSTSVTAGVVSIATGPDGTTSVNLFKDGFFPQRGLGLHTALGIAFCVGLSLLILQAKRLLGNVGYVFVGLLSAAGALVGGLILGLLFTAYLTTQAHAFSADVAERLSDAPATS